MSTPDPVTDLSLATDPLAPGTAVADTTVGEMLGTGTPAVEQPGEDTTVDDLLGDDHVPDLGPGPH